MLSHFFKSLVEKYSVLTIIALMFTLPFVRILCLDANAISEGKCKVGVKRGDWIEYEIKWANPPLPPYSVWVRREILDVEGTIITVNITRKMFNESVINETKEGDVANGTGAADVMFIPSNLKPGDLVNIEAFGPVSINGTTQRTYLGTERTVLWANFSSTGFDILIFWDKEKGVALEIHHSRVAAQGTTKVIDTNLWASGSLDDNNNFLGLGTLVLIIIILLIAFVIRKRYMSSKRKKRSLASQRLKV